jgi:hypothetical protein
MERRISACLVTLAFGLSLASAASALPPPAPPEVQRPNANAGMVILDAFVVRPLTAVGSVLTTALCVATLPFTVPTGLSEPAARVLIEAPWKFTADRYVGYFNWYKHGPPNLDFVSD